ncbi:MAG: ATP-dependent helicase, partial [Acidimicrobiia bacterium]|nr:ATP-dependent helicase [Acidimicrobiia bacterium]NNL28835.1 ATP-dependent helicase [Acidimicrobiia bacterium]
MATIDVHPERWDEVIAETEGPQIVVGGPGTGKTEFLVRRAVHLIDHGTEPATIAVLGFSRRGAAEIRSRIEARLGQTTAAVAASTYHSLAMRIIESFGHSGGEPPALLTAPEQVAFVADLLASEDPTNWSALYQPLLHTSRFAQEVTDFLLRCAEQRIGPDEVAGFQRDDWRGLSGFFAKYVASLEAAGRLDYGSLIVQAVELLEDDEIGPAVSSQFQYVLADEYQDTSRVQARFLQSLAKHHRHLTAAADPYQSVYSFRGTDLANVGRFPDEFRDSGGRPARRFVLTTSFRVPGEILRSAEALTHKLDLPGAAGPVIGVESAGRVDAHRFDQATEEAEWIAREIERTHIVEGTPYENIAVFVRTKKRFMSELSRALERRGIPHNRPDSRLVDHPAVRILFDLVTAATTSGADRNRSLRRLSLGPLLELPPGEFHRLSSEQETRGWDAVLREHSPGGTAIAKLISDQAWATTSPAAEGLWHIWDTLPQLADMANDPDRRDERFGWSSISQVLGRQFERDESVTLHQYLGWTEKDDFEADPLLRHHATQAPEVTLTSLHQAKGLEFDTVFIADAVEGVFPDLRSRESLLGSRHLSSSLPTDVVEYRRFRLQEEARLAYTAMTRASRRVVWTATSAGDDFRPGGPSRFLDRLGVQIDHPPDTALPVSVLEGEAWLRRIAADPAAGGHARSAAIENLATGPAWGG